MSERTRYPQTNPKPDDVFTRASVIAYLDEIPLGYRSESEHKFAESLIQRAQRHFSELNPEWVSPND